MAQHALLLVEDDPAIAQFLLAAFKTDGRYRMDHASSLAEVQEQVRSRQRSGLSPWLVILLDLGLPDGDGLDLIPWLRNLQPEGLLIILSARHREQDKIRALQSGADDYLTKPFTIGELLARLEAHLRRTLQVPDSRDLQRGDWCLHEDRRLRLPDGRETPLTTKEYLILRLLLQHAGQVIPAPRLLMAAWGPKQLEQTHYLRIYIQRLREKIETDANRPVHLLTEMGVGYRLVLHENASPPY